LQVEEEHVRPAAAVFCSVVLQLVAHEPHAVSVLARFVSQPFGRVESQSPKPDAHAL
jgi:hypothetical protein